MTWVDQSSLFGFGAVLTSTQMQNMRDNLTAVAEGHLNAPVVQGASKRLLAKRTMASSQEHMDLNSLIVSSFDIYELEFYNISVNTGGYFGVQFSDDNGASFYTSSLNYSNYDGFPTKESTQAGNNIPLALVASSPKGMASGKATLYDPSSNSFSKLMSVSGVQKFVSLVSNSYQAQHASFKGVSSISDYNSIRITPTSAGVGQHFLSGTVLLYGINTNSY